MRPRLTVTAAVATLAASVALSPLITGMGWFWAGLGAVLVSAAVGTLTRARAVPAIACFPAALAAEFWYLNAVFAGLQSRWRLIPTGDSLHHLVWLTGQAISAMGKYAPPVPGSRGIALLAAAGIGVVGASVDLFAVRLRRPALAGLPLLVLFCVPLTTSTDWHGFGAALVFSLAIAGYLALLSADGRDRLRLWGRLVRTRHGDPDARGPDTRPLGAAGRRIGFAAVAMALCVPLLIPGLRPHQLFGGGGKGHSGAAALTLPEPLVQLNKQLHASRPQTVLTYHTSDPTPPYLQVYVLSQLTTDSWRLAVPHKTVPLGSGSLPRVPGLGSDTRVVTVREQIHLGDILTSAPTTLSYLPAPYAPRKVQVHGTWRVDRDSLGVLTADTKLAGLRYSVTSADADPSARQLRQAPAAAAAAAGYLGYPQEFGRLLPLAKRITADASTPYDKAVALQDWFTRPGNFTYTLQAPEPHSASALISFLTHTKRGYCQQFAFGMAVLARLLDIPSRVVVGYTQGTPAGRNTWRVTTSDAHAWPELYFQGAGWLRFEPTPSGSPGHPGQATASTPVYTVPTPGGGGPAPHPTPSASTAAGVPGGGSRVPGVLSKLNHLAGSRSGSTATPRAHSSFPAVPVLLGVLVPLLLAPPTARPLIRRIRWMRAAGEAGHAHAAWRELLDDLADYRIGWRPSETPRMLAGRLTGDLGLHPAAQEALRRITQAEERARYAKTASSPDHLRADSTVLRRAMARACPLPERCAAVLAPASVLIPVRDALAQALDVFGWMDAVSTSIRTRFRRRDRAPATAWHG